MDLDSPKSKESHQIHGFYGFYMDLILISVFHMDHGLDLDCDLDPSGPSDWRILQFSSEFEVISDVKRSFSCMQWPRELFYTGGAIVDAADI